MAVQERWVALRPDSWHHPVLLEEREMSTVRFRFLLKIEVSSSQGGNSGGRERGKRRLEVWRASAETSAQGLLRAWLC